MEHKRGNWGSNLGFLLAAVGSAVGLGNIWAFPYKMGANGGFAFLLVYVILAVFVGFVLMVTELAIGRKTGKSVIATYKQLSKPFGWVGWLAMIVPFLILSFYSVLGAYTLEYAMLNLSNLAFGSQGLDGGTLFTNMLTTPFGTVLFTIGYLLIALLIVKSGIKGGIEKFSVYAMPALFVMLLIVIIRAVTLPGAGAGLEFMFKPDFTYLKEHFPRVLSVAGTQMFFSMSLAMGIMVTYGSYMPDGEDIEKSVGQIELFDTGVALLAGLMIIPAVFAFSGGDSEALNAGPGLMFVTMPKVFASMHLGTLIGIVFFLLVFFAALTSCISLYETVVSILGDRFHMNRRNSCIVTYIICIVLGLLSAMGYGTLSGIQPLGMAFLDFFDFISNSVLMPIVALLSCLFLGWVVGIDYIAKEVKKNSSFRREPMFRVMIRWIAPIFLVAILVSSVLCALGIISI